MCRSASHHHYNINIVQMLYDNIIRVCGRETSNKNNKSRTVNGSVAVAEVVYRPRGGTHVV